MWCSALSAEPSWVPTAAGTAQASPAASPVERRHRSPPGCRRYSSRRTPPRPQPVQSVRTDVAAEVIDAAGEAVIAEAGMREFFTHLFTHRTGPRTGVDSHQGPYVAVNRTMVVPGRAFSIRPLGSGARFEASSWSLRKGPFAPPGGPCWPRFEPGPEPIAALRWAPSCGQVDVEPFQDRAPARNQVVAK